MLAILSLLHVKKHLVELYQADRPCGPKLNPCYKLLEELCLALWMTKNPGKSKKCLLMEYMEHENSVYRILHATPCSNTQAAKQLLSVKGSGFRFCNLNCYSMNSHRLSIFKFIRLDKMNVNKLEYGNTILRIFLSIWSVLSCDIEFFSKPEIGSLPAFIFIYAKSLYIL